ncbi:ribonuclease P protein subunit p40-like isoform X1 [Crassostrea angulata]|uniref:ribonuclease P protein subunit p40-like isoform X1 n=1 Tax=Magallana angulata TaxID=2784310 RepID=UPI0022B10ED4|nr:ribonuclease P protein subunit p40-like isoform X1 [Crassostrea angulata]
MAAPMKNTTLHENLKISTLNFAENEENLKWISDMICMKHSIGVTMTKMDQLPPSISEACMDEMSFIVYSLPVHELINSDLLGAFQKKGSLCMLSVGTKLEVNDCVAILPTGQLILHLTKDSYTRLGLDGKPSHFNKFGGEKYVVNIDISSPVFAPGKKNYERVKQCLLGSSICCDFLVSWSPQDDKLCPSSIHRYFCLKGFGCVHLTLSAKSHKYTNIKIPDLQHQDAEVYHQEELYDWLGGVANQILWSSESDEEYSPLGDYSGPTNLGHCAHNQVFGFFSSITLRGLIKEVRQLCKSSNTWGCVTVHGFSDSVTSIGKSEKNFHKLCADSVTLVLSPSDRCWLFTDT